MQIDKTLILAAGKGTRMGEIGKVLPKVLWPIFEKSILELEIEYVKSLSRSKIFINSYHHHKSIASYFKENKLSHWATLIEEPSEIDIGGAVHNLCQLTGYEGNLLIVNSDQFLMLNKEFLSKSLDFLNEYDGVLFVTSVNSSDGYNQVETNNQRKFMGIKANQTLPRNQQIETYIGASIVKLSSLTPTSGKSKFFETVAHPEKMNFICINVDEFNYWDFGTLKQYYDNMFKLLNSNDTFKQFLIQHEAIKLNKLSSSRYNSLNANSINLTDRENVQVETNTILLKGLGQATNGISSIVFDEIIQKID